MTNGRMSRANALEDAIKYFSANWETEGTPDFERLADVLKMAADESTVEFAPVGYAEAGNGARVRVDGQFRRGVDEGELAEFGSMLGKAVAAHVSMRAITPDMAHPDDVIAAKRIRAMCDEGHLSAKYFVLLKSLDDEDIPSLTMRPCGSSSHRPFGRRSSQLFGGTATFACGTNWEALKRAISFLDDDRDVEISMGSIEREGDRVRAVMVAKVDGDGDAEAGHIRSLVAGSLGCEADLRELGHTMAEVDDLALMEKAELRDRRGFHRLSLDADGMVDALREAAESEDEPKQETAEEQLSRVMSPDSPIAENGTWSEWLRDKVHDFVELEFKAEMGRYSLSLFVGDLMESLGASMVIVPDASDGDRHGIPEPPTEFPSPREDPDRRDANEMSLRPYADVIAAFSEMRAVACIWVFGADETLGITDIHDFLDCIEAMRDMSREDYVYLPWIVTNGRVTDGALLAAAKHLIAVTGASDLATLAMRFAFGR